jgi:hypothetical protein
MRPGNLNTAIAVAALSTAAALGLAFFVALPAYRDSVQTGEKLVVTESQVQAQYNSRKKLSETTERIKSARQILKELQAQFLPNGSELELITAVEKIGDDQGVVTRLTMSPGGGVAGLTEYDKNFALSIKGPYAKVLDALVDFERLPFLASYDSLTLDSGGDGADSPLILELRGFVASPPQKI